MSARSVRDQLKYKVASDAIREALYIAVQGKEHFLCYLLEMALIEADGEPLITLDDIKRSRLKAEGASNYRALPKSAGSGRRLG